MSKVGNFSSGLHRQVWYLQATYDDMLLTFEAISQRDSCNSFYCSCGMCRLVLQSKEYVVKKLFLTKRNHLQELTKTCWSWPVLLAFTYLTGVSRNSYLYIEDEIRYNKGQLLLFKISQLLPHLSLWTLSRYLPPKPFQQLGRTSPANCDQCEGFWIFFPCFLLHYSYQLGSLPLKLFLQLVLSISW